VSALILSRFIAFRKTAAMSGVTPMSRASSPDAELRSVPPRLYDMMRALRASGGSVTDMVIAFPLNCRTGQIGMFRVIVDPIAPLRQILPRRTALGLRLCLGTRIERRSLFRIVLPQLEVSKPGRIPERFGDVRCVQALKKLQIGSVPGGGVGGRARSPWRSAARGRG